MGSVEAAGFEEHLQSLTENEAGVERRWVEEKKVLSALL